MKRFTGPVIFMLAVCLWAAIALGDSIKLHYNLKPGQKWVCHRLSQTEFMIMGKKQIQRNRHTIEYTVSKGTKKGWVKIAARYIDPPAPTDENKYSLGLYDLTFHADMHSSGDTRNIRVQGADKPIADPTLDASAQAALIQGKQMMADSYKAAVFWFPELAEEPLVPGDEFEYKQTHHAGGNMMTYKAQSRQVFVLDDISQGLAYFTLKESTRSKNSAMGSEFQGTISGKGQTIFDLKNGMWTEMVIKRKMKFSGAGMMGAGGQDMFMVEKIDMEQL
jgi:hypothetical protein